MDKEYSQYKAEDFIQDDYFIRSVYTPTLKSRIFWNSRLQKKTISPEEYKLAVKYLNIVPVKKRQMSVAEKEILKKNIFSQLQFTRVAKRKKQLYLYIAAATIAILIVSTVFFRPYFAKDPLTSFAEYSQVPKSKKIELILSEDKRLSLHDEDVSIQYEQTGDITVNKEKIAKKENSPYTEKKTKTEYNQLIVPFGKRTMLTLSDNTQILVNAGTRIVYPVTFDEDKREIFVEGEVFLDVTPNPDKPFIVKTSQMRIKVTGTSFNITAYQNETEQSVVLVKGSVKVRGEKNTRESILKPNDRYLDSKGKISVSQVDVSDYISWKDGVYIFKNESLKNILTRLSRYYDAKIQVDNKAAILSCSGKLDLKDDITRVLNALATTAPVIYLQNEENTYIFKYKP